MHPQALILSLQPVSLNATEMTVTLTDSQVHKGEDYLPLGSRFRPREDLRLFLRKQPSWRDPGSCYHMRPSCWQSRSFSAWDACHLLVALPPAQLDLPRMPGCQRAACVLQGETRMWVEWHGHRHLRETHPTTRQTALPALSVLACLCLLLFLVLSALTLLALVQQSLLCSPAGTWHQAI